MLNRVTNRSSTEFIEHHPGYKPCNLWMYYLLLEYTMEPPTGTRKFLSVEDTHKSIKFSLKA